MPAVRTEISVAKCDECPFFERSVFNPFIEWLAKAPVRSGTCKCPGLGPVFLLKRLDVPDADRIPDACPLKLSDHLIKLSVRA